MIEEKSGACAYDLVHCKAMRIESLKLWTCGCHISFEPRALAQVDRHNKSLQLLNCL